MGESGMVVTDRAVFVMRNFARQRCCISVLYTNSAQVIHDRWVACSFNVDTNALRDERKALKIQALHVTSKNPKTNHMLVKGKMYFE